MTDWINHQQVGRGFFEPVRFNGWPEVKEELMAGHLPATFMIVPMALRLREEGVPVKIVYLGHRDGTAMMVHRESTIRTIRDLKGKRIAVPNKYSNQYLIVTKALASVGLTMADVTLQELAPPDMPVALHSRSVDAIISGEPFMAQTEFDEANRYGRVLFYAKEIWPDFISCALVVREEVIDSRPEVVQSLVSGIARSGKWLDADQQHRIDAATTVAKEYYNQDPRLLEFVLTKPPDRVTYSRLALAREEFERIVELAVETGLLSRKLAFEEYADVTFSDQVTLTDPTTATNSVPATKLRAAEGSR